MVSVSCPRCEVSILVPPYRTRNGKRPFCSVSCSKKWLAEHGWKPSTAYSSNSVLAAREMYEKSHKSIIEIARRLEVSRSSIFSWARQGKWKRAEKSKSFRNSYRKAAELKIGRKLIAFEHVHHKDGNSSNNRQDNLFVFSNAQCHTRSHKSLEKCAFELYAKGIIKFDELTGMYRIG